MRSPDSGFVHLPLFVLLLFAAVAGDVLAQDPPVVLPDHPSPETIEVYLVTIGPGDEVWNRFGHNALWIRDERQGWDVAYNYGLFDFDQPGFLTRFIQGRMMYWMGGTDPNWMLHVYRSENRDVRVQRLHLEPRAALRLASFLEWNARPENREYRYDYYLDNCSTRIRDAIDIALDGALRRQTDGQRAEMNFREHSLRLVGDDLLYYTGLQVGLGPFVDRGISWWEEMFLPEKVEEYLQEVTVPDGEGSARPLAGDPIVLFEADRPEPLAVPPRRIAGFGLVGLLLGGGIALLGWLGGRRRGPRIAMVAAGTVWGLVAGVAGFLLLFLWLGTDHTAAYRNENMFHLNPLALALVVAFPVWLRRAMWRREMLGVAWALPAISLLGVLLGMLPAFPQVNAEIAALALPINLGTAIGITLLVAPMFQRSTAL